MNWLSILIRSPIDRLTKLVTSQRSVSGRDAPLSRDDLIQILDRTARKQRLLKHVLGIRTQSQHNNFKHKWNIGARQFRVEQEPRAALEYVRLGDMMLKYQGELREVNEREKIERIKSDALIPRIPTLIVSTTRKSGIINAYREDRHWHTLPESKRRANAEGRVFEYFSLTQTASFLACATQHGAVEAAQQCILELERT